MLEIEDDCERDLKVDLLVDERVKDQHTWRSQLLCDGRRFELLCGRGMDGGKRARCYGDLFS